MQNLKDWTRAADMISSEFLIEGKPDIATQITGYEV
jgi:hypothetical protein